LALGLFVLATALLGVRLDHRLRAADDAAGRPANQLTDDEKKLGWRLLFDGKSLAGWHSFKRKDVLPGWQVKDGTLACVDPDNAGDLCTDDQYEWFDLSLEYNITPAGNSGIMFHVTNDGGATWQTGPEVQLEDNAKAKDPERCGWIYQLYKPPVDTKTNKRLDATKPAGEWNQIRVLIAPPPAKSEVSINGVKYFDFVYNSDDFKDRIAKSKFRSMKKFAKYDRGMIALQGDHGSIAFRNVKIREITGKTP
jgi:hypothetical protein